MSRVKNGRRCVALDGHVQRVDEVVRENKMFTENDLCVTLLEVWSSSLYSILTELCARWVPKMLPNNHKTRQMASDLTFLAPYDAEREDFLKSVVTGDEFWVRYDRPETKQQPQQRMHTNSRNKPNTCKPKGDGG